MPLLESGEMYLETILLLSRQKPYVRAVDIGEYMGFSKPSVSRAMGILKADGYIAVDPDGHIILTEKGVTAATAVYERHTVIQTLLQKLGVDEVTAAEDACKIEHVISDRTFEAIKNAL